VVDRRSLSEADRHLFASPELLLQAPMQQITLDRRSGVSRLDGESTYFVKNFRGRGSRLKFCLGISRYQRELRNLNLFKTLGLNTPDLVAYGHRSRFGLFQQAVLVTREVSGAADLAELLNGGSFYRDGVRGARAILKVLAEATRTLHEAGFYHRDLKPRNILVKQGKSGPELYFFDCPSGHRPPRFLLHRGIVRDLAHLEEGLRSHLRRVDMLYLYQRYLGSDRLSGEDKTLAGEVLAYFPRRRMTRKRKRREREKRVRA
jgi:tRNA A-37 threonylcarbamoyl transferase component Bud32